MNNAFLLSLDSKPIFLLNSGLYAEDISKLISNHQLSKFIRSETKNEGLRGINSHPSKFSNILQRGCQSTIAFCKVILYTKISQSEINGRTKMLDKIEFVLI